MSSHEFSRMQSVSLTPSIEEATSTLGFSEQVKITARDVYLAAKTENLTRGSYNVQSKAAALYLSCRICDSAVTPSDVADVFGISEKDVLKRSRSLTKSLHLPVPPANPATYIDQYSTAVGASTETVTVAHEILVASEAEGLTSGSPSGVAASCLYGAAVETDAAITQERIAAVADISPVTIRNRYTDQLTALAQFRQESLDNGTHLPSGQQQSYR